MNRDDAERKQTKYEKVEESERERKKILRES